MLLHRGTPPYAETQNYIAKITAAARPSPTRTHGGVGSRRRHQVTTARSSRPRGSTLAPPYVWGGGGGIAGPSGGGFDCSGLTSFAVHAASAGTVTLPRTSEQQWKLGVEIPIVRAQPGGDLVFGSWGTERTRPRGGSTRATARWSTHPRPTTSSPKHRFKQG